MAKLKMTWIKEKKAPLFVASGLCLVLAAGLGTGLWLASEKEEEVTYREVQAEYGELTVGLEESGNVTVGTTEQTFDLDLSAYTGSSSDGFFREWEGRAAQAARVARAVQVPGI